MTQEAMDEEMKDAEATEAAGDKRARDTENDDEDRPFRLRGKQSKVVRAQVLKRYMDGGEGDDEEEAAETKKPKSSNVVEMEEVLQIGEKIYSLDMLYDEAELNAQ